jgi:hypothetical protein
VILNGAAQGNIPIYFPFIGTTDAITASSSIRDHVTHCADRNEPRERGMEVLFIGFNKQSWGIVTSIISVCCRHAFCKVY